MITIGQMKHNNPFTLLSCGCDAIIENSVSTLDCKTAPSFARNPEIGVFDRVLARGREMGERGEEGALAARLLPRPVLPFHDRAPKLDQKPRFRISGEGRGCFAVYVDICTCNSGSSG